MQRSFDGRQVEGIQSTGANALQRARFGVIPQVTPVLLSQVLCYFESNTRSATVVGAIVGGGIGLMLTHAIITQKNWEEVSYYMVLIVLMVMAMDTLSGWLRARLIKGTRQSRHLPSLFPAASVTRCRNFRPTPPCCTPMSPR